jgi:hypothetical protein
LLSTAAAFFCFTHPRFLLLFFRASGRLCFSARPSLASFTGFALRAPGAGSLALRASQAILTGVEALPCSPAPASFTRLESAQRLAFDVLLRAFDQELLKLGGKGF